jgi:hypothetical protein
VKYRNDKSDVTGMSMTRDQFFDLLGTDDWLIVAADVHVDGGLRAGNWPSFGACFYTMGKYSLSDGLFERIDDKFLHDRVLFPTKPPRYSLSRKPT